jgi:hypothetical protein
MEYISPAGVAWLSRHDLNIDWMINRWRQGEPVTPRPRWVDNEYNPEGYPDPNGDITFEKGLWRTHQYLERISYRELGSRHAKLEIDRLQLPETVLASVGKSNPKPLGSIIDIPRESIASEAMGQIIRIVNRPDNLVELLMRIAWHPVTTAWMLEQL